jgi:hypothetical protein
MSKKVVIFDATYPCIYVYALCVGIIYYPEGRYNNDLALNGRTNV